MEAEAICIVNCKKIGWGAFKNLISPGLAIVVFNRVSSSIFAQTMSKEELILLTSDN